MGKEGAFYSSRRGPKSDFAELEKNANNWLPKLRRVAQTDSGCLEWQGAKNGRGYGVVSAYQMPTGQAKLEYTHRLAFFAASGPIPADRVVDHKCKNPSCINPDHLRLLTHEDNARTAKPEPICRTCGGQKHRQRSGRMSCAPCANERARRHKRKKRAA